MSLSPNDYRFWMSLGTAYEQAGDPAKAEHALRRAVALAPSYAYPHWYLGNLLFEMVVTTKRLLNCESPVKPIRNLQPQLFNLIWADLQQRSRSS